MAADLHGLEIAFAKNPTLEACLPLCEAYIEAKRYMEAMVVCKKGMKSASLQDVRGRLMLARIFTEQGKPAKAETELLQLVAEVTANADGWAALARIQLALGKKTEAGQAVEKALAIESQHEGALQLAALMGHVVAAKHAGPVSKPAAASSTSAPAAGPAVARAAQASHGVSKISQIAASPVATATAVASAPAEQPASMSGVSDFFAPESLGFKNDAVDIETAGPGRLTILGFVPQNTGNLKRTLLLLLGIFGIGAGVVVWQIQVSTQQKEIGKLVGQMRDKLTEDRMHAYHDIVKLGEQVLLLDAQHTLTLSLMAYAHAVLVIDHGQANSQAACKTLLERAMAAGSGKEAENEFRVAARTMLAFIEKSYDRGLADIKTIQDSGGSTPLVELEAMRLWDAVKPEEKESKLQMRRLVQSVSNQARAYTYLGSYNLSHDDASKASKYFDQAVQNAKGHPLGTLGRIAAGLETTVSLKDRIKDIEKEIKEQESIPAEELSAPLRSWLLYAKGLLALQQGDEATGQPLLQEAIKLDPSQWLFPYRLGILYGKAGASSKAIEWLRKAAAIAPLQARIFKHLTLQQAKVGDGTAASAALEQFNKLLPQDPESKLLQGAILRANKRYGEALAMYRSVTNEDGTEVLLQAQLGIARVLRESADKEGSIKHLEAYLASATKLSGEAKAKLFCEMAAGYESKGAKGQAETSYALGASSSPYYPSCHLGLCKLLAGRTPEGRAACRTYLDLEPMAVDGKELAKLAGSKG